MGSGGGNIDFYVVVHCLVFWYGKFDKGVAPGAGHGFEDLNAKIPRKLGS